MQKIQSIIEHIEKVYDFKIVPCSIPRDNFQRLKRAFYIFVLNKVSEKLFYFLRDKVSPIKYLKIRPDREIWLKKRLDRGLCEIEIIPIPAEAAIYITDEHKLYNPINGDGNYKVKIYYPTIDESELKEFPINIITGCKSIDAHFCDVPELKETLRDYKLNSLGV